MNDGLILEADLYNFDTMSSTLFRRLSSESLTTNSIYPPRPAGSRPINPYWECMQVMVYLQRHQSLTSAEEVEYDASRNLSTELILRELRLRIPGIALRSVDRMIDTMNLL